MSPLLTASPLSVVLAIMAGLFLSLDAKAAPPSAKGGAAIAEAKKNLEVARANVAKAVERIKQDPPSNTDLDLARDAVAALKSAIDAGAEYEPKDLEYAKAALAARKELRQHREYVEDRRSKVQVFESRRELDRGLEKLTSAARRLDAQKPSGKDFQDARAAAEQLDKLIASGQAFSASDAGYAKRLEEVKDTLARHRKSIDARETSLVVVDRKAAIEQGRASLAAALAALDGKNPTDAQFELADAKVTELSHLLEDPKGLETKDADFHSYAEKARDQVRDARKRIDGKWSETGLARMKAELEPARTDLVQAAHGVRGKNPTPDQLAEARTAAIVLDKMLEKFRNLAARNAAAAQYLAEVKRALVEVQADLQKRKLAAVRDEVNATQKALLDKDATEEAFKRAEEALKQAMQVLAEGARLEKDDRAFAAYAMESRKQFVDARAKIATRRGEIEVGRQRAGLEEARRDLTQALRPLERRAPTDEQFAEANSAAIVLEKSLEAARPALRKDAALVAFGAQLRDFLQAAKTTITKRRLEVDVERQRTRIEAVRAEITTKLGKVAGSKDPALVLKEVEEAVERVRTMLAEGAALTKKDGGYSAYDREIKKRMDEVRARIATQRDALAFQAQRGAVEVELKNLTLAMRTVESKSAGAPAVEAVEQALKRVEDALSAGLPLEKQLAPYANWAKQARKTHEAIKARFAKRKLELAAGDTRSMLKDQLSTLVAALELAKQPDATDKEIALAGERLKATQDELQRGAALEKEEKGYAAFADQTRGELARIEGEIELAKQLVSYRKETVLHLSEGARAAQEASQARTLRDQRAGFEKAVASFKACERGGGRILDEIPALKATAVLVEGESIPGKKVIALCAERAESTGEELRKVVGLLTFHEGPKAAYEKGKALVSDKGAKKEALTLFEECISSGMILQHKNPELKDRKFDVAGTRMTLAELVAACTHEAQKLRGK